MKDIDGFYVSLMPRELGSPRWSGKAAGSTGGCRTFQNSGRFVLWQCKSSTQNNNRVIKAGYERISFLCGKLRISSSFTKQ